MGEQHDWWLLTMSPFWRRPLAKRLAVFHVLEIAAAVRVEEKGFPCAALHRNGGEGRG